MLPIAVYILVGLLVCLIVIHDRKRLGRKGRSSLWMVFDPVWPIVLLWPVFLAFAYIDDDFPESTGKPGQPQCVLVGTTALVVSALRPTGRIQIGGEQHDARSMSGLIPEGSTVRIIGKSMAEFLVEQAPNPESCVT